MLPEASGARPSAVACVPCVSVASFVLEALAADRRLTPSGSLTQIENGRPSVAGVTAAAAFGIGNDAGQVVGDAGGSTVIEGDGRGGLATAWVLLKDVSGPASRKAAMAPMTIRGIRRR